MEKNTVRLLIVEDNPIDVRMLRYALDQEPAWPFTMTVAEDGEKAISVLSQSVLSDTKPDFVILDLNLPKRDGTEVLQWIRNGELRNVPVAVVSSSPIDVIRTKVSGAAVEANCYFVKPADVESFLTLGRKLQQCFISTRNAAVRTGQPSPLRLSDKAC